jgi:hypothetical protein
MNLKVFLTTTGLMVRDGKQYYFFSNDGEYRRRATREEGEMLEEILSPIKLLQEEGLKEELLAAIQNTEDLWSFVLEVKISDYESHKSETCFNGGDYAFHTKQMYFGKKIGNKLHFRMLEIYTTSAKFEYDELHGNFQSNLNLVEITGTVMEIRVCTRSEDSEIHFELESQPVPLSALLYASNVEVTSRYSKEGSQTFETPYGAENVYKKIEALWPEYSLFPGRPYR